MSKLFSYKYLLTKHTFFTGIIILSALFFALYPFLTQYIYGFDQARDGYEAYAIWHNHDVKIQGPSSDIPGINHGVLWYYLLAFLYGVFHFTIFPVLTTFFLLSFLTIPFVGLFAQVLFKNKYIAFITMILYAFSPMFQAFTRWLSNPVLAIYITPLLLMGIYFCLKKPSFLTFLATGIGYGLLVQADFAYSIFLLTVPFYFYFLKNKKDKSIVGFIIGLLAAVSSFILVEIKFHGKTVIALSHFFFSPQHMPAATSKLSLAADKIQNLFSSTILPVPYAVVIVMVCLVWIFYKRKNIEKKDYLPLGLLLIWLINLPIFFLFDIGITKTLFAYGPTFMVLILLTSYFLVTYIKRPVIISIVVVVICLLQLKVSWDWIDRHYNPYTAQQNIFYSDATKVIDYTYSKANHEPFSIATITNPLGINTTWAFLYTFYGSKKYGYTPSWAGNNQDGYLGILPKTTGREKDQFLLIEPKDVIPEIYITNETDKMNRSLRLVEKKKYGEYLVLYYQNIAKNK